MGLREIEGAALPGILSLLCADFCFLPVYHSFPAIRRTTEETDSNADRYRESDRSSNLSDVKADIRAGSSVSNAESVTALDSEGEGSTRGVNALALAGPVPNPLGYRYSADYTEPSFPPKNNVSNSQCHNGPGEATSRNFCSQSRVLHEEDAGIRGRSLT